MIIGWLALLGARAEALDAVERLVRSASPDLSGLNAMLATRILRGEPRFDAAVAALGTYPLLRIDEAPEIEILFVQSTEPPTGLGEMTFPGIMPAVANAVFDATGVRVRRLPIRAEEVQAG
jgi:CO/xanthine dehydrogenase Mo-binding subunit